MYEDGALRVGVGGGGLLTGEGEPKAKQASVGGWMVCRLASITFECGPLLCTR